MADTKFASMLRTYAYIWANFAAWCEVSGKTALPSTPEVIAKYLAERANAGARPSTLRVTAAAIARRHFLDDLDNPCEAPQIQKILEESFVDATPGQRRVLPLDMDCYRAIRETAHEPRPARGGRLETASAARRRGNVDVAMVGLMRDARLKVREAAALAWSDIEKLSDGTGKVTVPGAGAAGTDTIRAVSSSTMRALATIAKRTEPQDKIVNLSPNRIGTRIRDAAIQAGLGSGYGGESPRMGMLADMESLCVELLGEFSDSEQ